jgi:hypothetical protein
MPETKRRGFLLVMMDCPPTLEDEFNAWYDTEHLPERLAVPGFLTAMRFVCLDGHPKYLAMYDLASADVLDSPAYLKVAHANSSPWTRRVTSRVRVYRAAGEQIHGGGAITAATARVTIVRFRGLAKGDAAAVVAGVRAAFESQPTTVQTRILAYDTGSGIDYLGFIGATGPHTPTVAAGALGSHAAAVDLINTYARY